MASYTKCDEAGGGAAMFDTRDGWYDIEIQVDPMGFRVYLSSTTAYKARRAQWLGAEAAPC